MSPRTHPSHRKSPSLCRTPHTCLPRPTHVPHSLTAALYMTGSDFVYIGDESGTVQVVNFTKPLSLAMYKIAPTDTGA